MKQVLTKLSVASLLVCAAGLAPILVFTGPYLAMGVQIYGGYTEPTPPSLAFPWWGVAGLVLSAGVLMVVSGRREERGWSWASLGCAAAALVWQALWFLELVRAAGPQSPQ